MKVQIARKTGEEWISYGFYRILGSNNLAEWYCYGPRESESYSRLAGSNLSKGTTIILRICQFLLTLH
jgi:hypothetical protein